MVIPNRARSKNNQTGRRAIINVKSNAGIKGFNVRAEMLRFREEYPETFYRILRLPNNVESVFSSMRRGSATPRQWKCL